MLLGRFQQEVAVARKAFQGDRNRNGRRHSLRFNMNILLGVQGARDGEADANVIRHDEIIHSAAQTAGRIMADDRGAIVNRQVVGEEFAGAEAAGRDDDGDFASVARVLAQAFGQAEAVLRSRDRDKSRLMASL